MAMRDRRNRVKGVGLELKRTREGKWRTRSHKETRRGPWGKCKNEERISSMNKEKKNARKKKAIHRKEEERDIKEEKKK